MPTRPCASARSGPTRRLSRRGKPVLTTSRSGCRTHFALLPRRTSSRRRPSAPTTCSRACRGWRIFRPSPSARYVPDRRRRAPPRTSAVRAGCWPGSRADSDAARRRTTRTSTRRKWSVRRAPPAANPPIQQAPPPTPASEFAKQPQPRRMGEQAAAVGSLDPRGRPVPTRSESRRTPRNPGIPAPAVELGTRGEACDKRPGARGVPGFFVAARERRVCVTMGKNR